MSSLRLERLSFEKPTIWKTIQELSLKTYILRAYLNSKAEYSEPDSFLK